MEKECTKLHQDRTIVLVKEDNTPPLKWSMDRILEVHPVQDGVVRVASLKMNNTIVKRALSKLCPFPFEIEERSPHSMGKILLESPSNSHQFC